ncbi:MAG TPA: cytochrome P450 [Acidimicrobiales bacterium]|jgi:cytochrome P450|nr:cytochrome P450 [Acidimicrobiales bacterium]
MVDMSAVTYDPSSYEVQADPFPFYRRMQDEAPLYHHPEMGFWALTRFDDVLGGLGDWASFSSAQGTLIEQIQSDGSPPDMMIFHDPPRHEQLRRLVGRAFTPRRVVELDGKIRSMCSAWLDPLVDSGGGDIVADLAGLLPMAVIGALLGAPSEDNHRLKLLSDRLLHREDGSMEMPEDGIAAGAELYVYFSELIASRRATPADDLMTDLIGAEIVGSDGESQQLTENEIVAFCLLLGVAGNETTAKMIATGMVVLDQFPDERSRLVGQPDLWAGAVEEFLRFDPPSHYQGRVSMVPLVRHGEEIPEGSIVLLVNGAANRDPRAFDQPDRFIADRPIERHLAFGHGIHFCLGAPLARMETRIALEEIVRRFPRYEVDRAGIERYHSTNIRGLSKVPFRA